jgi:hypothetical protein
MDAPIMTSLFEEMMTAIHRLYKAAPPTPFKHGPEFYAALRAADKAKAYLNDDMDDLLTMEREDTRYWREKCLGASAAPSAPSPSFSMESADHIGIPVLPAFGSGLGHPCDRNIIVGTPLSGSQCSPVLNPEDDDDDMDHTPIAVAASATASVAEPPSQRARVRTVSLASSVSAAETAPVVLAPRPHINLFGITATPNMGPLLPSPLMTRDLIYDGI